MQTRRVVRPRDRSESSCESFFRRCRLPKKRLAKIHIWALSLHTRVHTAPAVVSGGFRMHQAVSASAVYDHAATVARGRGR